MELSDQHPFPVVLKVSLELARNRRRAREKEVTEGEHGGAASEHERVTTEHKGATGSIEGTYRRNGL